MATTEKAKKVIHLTPEGRLINHALFERDIYKDEKTGTEGGPKYKIEMVFDPDQVQGEGTIEDAIIEEGCAFFGDAFEDAYLDGRVSGPFKDGTEFAADREANGKKGDAYKGKIIMRADSKYNAQGNEDAGGAAVYGPGGGEDPVTVANKSVVYQGCFGIAAVTLHFWKDSRKQMCCKFYLSAFQKTRDGEKLVSSADHGKLFKPIGRAPGAEGDGGRRRRRG